MYYVPHSLGFWRSKLHPAPLATTGWLKHVYILVTTSYLPPVLLSPRTLMEKTCPKCPDVLQYHIDHVLCTAGLLHWTTAWLTVPVATVHVLVLLCHTYSFCGLKSQSHSDDRHVHASSLCSVRVFTHAHPTMSRIPLDILGCFCTSSFKAVLFTVTFIYFLLLVYWLHPIWNWMW